MTSSRIHSLNETNTIFSASQILHLVASYPEGMAVIHGSGGDISDLELLFEGGNNYGYYLTSGEDAFIRIMRDELCPHRVFFIDMNNELCREAKFMLDDPAMTEEIKAYMSSHWMWFQNQ